MLALLTMRDLPPAQRPRTVAADSDAALGMEIVLVLGGDGTFLRANGTGRVFVVAGGAINSPQLLELSGIGQPERLQALDQAAQIGAPYLSPGNREGLERVAKASAERRALSGDHTVVGFFGATGSGKTSLFNAVVGEDLGKAAARRPTTAGRRGTARTAPRSRPWPTPGPGAGRCR